MSPALAFLEKELESDLSPIEGLTTECSRCDPDNPSSVARETCPICRGSGRAPIALAAIVGEMKASRLELLVGGGRRKASPTSYEDDYIDPDDCI